MFLIKTTRSKLTPLVTDLEPMGIINEYKVGIITK